MVRQFDLAPALNPRSLTAPTRHTADKWDCLSRNCVGGICSDNDPPAFAGGTPAVQSVTDTSVQLALQLTEPGLVYIVIVGFDTQRPSVQQIQAGQAGDGGTPVAAATVDVSVAFAMVKYAIQAVLTPATTYKVYLVAADVSQPPNVQSTATKLLFTTDANDSYAPWFLNGFPRVTNVQDTSASIEVALNEPGTCYFAVLLAAEAAPSATQVLQGTVSGAVASGSASVSTAYVVAANTATGLTVDQDYIVYVVAQDLRTPPNAQTSPAAVAFRTGSSAGAPQIVSPFPLVSDVSSSGFSLFVQLTQPGWFFYLLLPSGWSAVPTSLQVVQGVDGAGSTQAVVAHGSKQVPQAGTSASTTLVNLPSDTAYDVYIVAVGATQLSVASLAVKRTVVTLPDNVAPEFVTGFPRLDDITSHSVTTGVALTEAGTTYCVVRLRSAASGEPSVLEVETNTVAGSVAFVVAPITAANTIFQLLAVGLTELTDYDLYVVARDNANPPNRVAAVRKLQFTTPADTFAPRFIVGYPAIVLTTMTDATVEVQLDDPGTIRCVVRAATDPEPSVAAVRAGDGTLGATTIVVTEALTTVTRVVGNNLSPGAAYNLWCVPEDSRGNIGSLRSTAFMTATSDTVPPQFVAGFPTIVSVSDTGGLFHAQVNEPATLFYVVLLASAAAPTATNVVAGSGAHGSTAAALGSVLANTPFATVATAMGGLTPGTNYVLYVVARDTAGNVLSPPVARPFLTSGGACFNGVKDGVETDVDCGGAVCVARCVVAKTCIQGSDCVSGVCTNGICTALCTGCGTDQDTLVPCTPTAPAVCRARAPSLVVGAAASNGLVPLTVIPRTASAFVVATRDGNAPNCATSSTLQQFDSAGQVAEIRLLDGMAQSQSVLATSAIVRALSCGTGGLANSVEAATIVVVHGTLALLQRLLWLCTVTDVGRMCVPHRSKRGGPSTVCAGSAQAG